MILGMTTFTFVHTLISLVAMAAGAIVVYELLMTKKIDGWLALYLVTIGATSLTGFGLPADHFLPSHAVAIISLVLLAAVVAARYVFHLSGVWRLIFVGGIVSTLWFDVFVGIVQAFLKIPALNALAPTQSEPPFAIVQIATLLIFIVLGVVTAIRYRRAAPV